MRRFLRRFLGVEQGLQSLRKSVDGLSQELSSVSKELSGVRMGLTPLRYFSLNDAEMYAQVNYLHAAILGCEIDERTPIEELVRSSGSREIAMKLLGSHRYREESNRPLWPKDKWVGADLHGLRIWLNLNDSHIAVGVLREDWEEQIVGFMLSSLKPGSTLVDVGANIGVYTLQGARAVGPGGKVFAFEPRSDTYQMLCRSIRENGFEDRCVPSKKGLSDAPGRA